MSSEAPSSAIARFGTDPQIARLPHPYRIEAAYERSVQANGGTLGGRDVHEIVLGAETYAALLAELQRSPLNAAVIYAMAPYPKFQKLAVEMTGGRGQSHFGNLFWLLDYIRWRTTGRHFLQTTDGLDAALLKTDIGADIPARYLRAPYDNQYLQFGESLNSTLVIWNSASGDHRIEGTYLRGGTVPLDTPPSPDGTKEAGRRFVEFIFTGSPLGKEHVLDDATSALVLTIPDEDMTVEQLLEVAMESDRKAGRTKTAHEDETKREAVLHAAKVLLYLNSDKVERNSINERTELTQRWARAGAGKKGKLERQILRSYDRIVIGPKTAPAPAVGAAPTDGTGRHVMSHWRRGHFRNQRVGEGRAQTRLTWISPILVKAEAALTLAGKPYTIK